LGIASRATLPSQTAPPHQGGNGIPAISGHHAGCRGVGPLPAHCQRSSSSDRKILRPSRILGTDSLPWWPATASRPNGPAEPSPG